MSGSMKRNPKLGEASTAKFTGNLVSNEKKVGDVILKTVQYKDRGRADLC